MQTCAIEIALRNNARTVIQEERRLAAIDRAVANLLLSTHSPANLLDDALLEVGDLAKATIRSHLNAIERTRDAVTKARHFEQIGRLISASAQMYAASLARRDAEIEVENACPVCFGIGCRHCGEEAA